MKIRRLLLKQVSSTRVIGKAATFDLLWAFPVILLGQSGSILSTIALPIGWAFAWWGTALYWVAGVLYAVQTRDVVRVARASRLVT